MRLKAFHDSSLAAALAQAHQSFGLDVLIVDEHEHAGSDGNAGCVWVALEDERFEPLPALFRATPPPVLDVGQTVSDVLFRHGVPPALIARMQDALIGMGSDEPLLALGMALDSLLDFQPLPTAANTNNGDGPVLALVGPPGGGKTLTVARLAARATFKGYLVRVITCDTARAGAVDQLAAFVRLLDVPLQVVDSPSALGDTLARSPPGELVLIDTAARNPLDPDDMADLRQFLAVGPIEPVLVLPAGTDALDAIDTGNAFRRLGVNRLVPTRLDTTRRLGSLIVAAHDTGLVCADAGTAPRVADGLTPLSSVALARLMMPEVTIPVRPARRTSRLSRKPAK